MRKTAMSAIIYEVLDMGTGLTDAHGELASSGQGIPAFVGVLDKAVKFISEKHSAPGAIEPGDVFITNDPYYGGVTHLNDVVVAMPVFAGKEIGCLDGGDRPLERCRRHGARFDVERSEGDLSGGSALAGGQTDRAWRAESAVLDISLPIRGCPTMCAATCGPAVAAVRLGERRILELVDKYGKAVYLESVSRYMEYGEQLTPRRCAICRKAASHCPRSRMTAGSIA